MSRTILRADESNSTIEPVKTNFKRVGLVLIKKKAVNKRIH